MKDDRDLPSETTVFSPLRIIICDFEANVNSLARYRAIFLLTKRSMRRIASSSSAMPVAYEQRI